MTSVNTMKRRITAYLANHTGATFADLNNDIKDFEGDFGFKLDTSNNPINLGQLEVELWSGMSREAHQAINELLAEQRIRFEPTNPVSYFLAGVIISLPVATEEDLSSYHDQRKEVWLPAVLIPNSGAVA